MQMICVSSRGYSSQEEKTERALVLCRQSFTNEERSPSARRIYLPILCESFLIFRLSSPLSSFQSLTNLLDRKPAGQVSLPAGGLPSGPDHRTCLARR
ncbi:hypothetical protein BDBG_17687 [Blastomyces gilchristii SLH14081]|uniref:Uncharacterized protein n=1 Tax=Blastomyces gilchristii (strain SLH14081) TaxID=559298 RepID=A0A179UWV2_BLAGS|nr:uncharacterized protein BDBG_17687 [Blastomyces gilchristii SLH14081]OAT12544.1 hypothetical protein BDBG_17687 [Blastomyces gilchristii SLH14081]